MVVAGLFGAEWLVRFQLLFEAESWCGGLRDAGRRVHPLADGRCRARLYEALGAAVGAAPGRSTAAGRRGVGRADDAGADP
jgi:hypothetical protein